MAYQMAVRPKESVKAYKQYLELVPSGKYATYARHAINRAEHR
jgi:hypothetical protein